MAPSRSRQLLALASTIFGLIVVGALFAQNWLAKTYWLIPVAALTCVVLITAACISTNWAKAKFELLAKRLPIFVTFLVLAVTFVSYSFLVFWMFFWGIKYSKANLPSSSTSPVETKAQQSPKAIPTLHSLFLSDFPNTMRVRHDYEVKFEDGTVVKLEIQSCEDYAAKARFISVYIPGTPFTERVAVRVANSIPQFLEMTDRSIATATSIDGLETKTSRTELIFTGRVFLYHETPLTLKQKDLLNDYYLKKELTLQFMGVSHVSDAIKATS